jgi:hypothetical protein
MSTTGLEKGLGIVSTLAALVALFSLYQADKSADVARQGLDLAERNERRLDRQDRQLYANKVYMGEPSPIEYRDHPPEPGSDIWRVVINASGLQVEDVWVADDFGRSVNIRGVQRCIMYALPADFEAKHLYFTDPNGRWHRPYGGQLEEVSLDAHPLPESDTDNSPWYAVLQDCAG